MTKIVRTFDLDPGTGRPHDQPTKLCRLFYLTSGEYALYSPGNTLLWRSDNIPPEAYVPYSRFEKLRECTDDIIRSDMGNNALQPELFAALKANNLEFGIMDPAIIPVTYPDILWLLELAEQQKE